MPGAVRLPFVDRRQILAGEHTVNSLSGTFVINVFFSRLSEQLQVVTSLISDMSLNVALPPCARGTSFADRGRATGL